MIIENCNVSADEADQVGRTDMRKLVVATHTNRRNNAIKNMRLRFYGKCRLCVVFVTPLLLTGNSQPRIVLLHRWHVR